MSSEEIPVIPKVSNLVVHSGNILNWDRLKRKPNQSPKEELAECIEATLTDYLGKADRNELQTCSELDCSHTKFKETLPSDERGDLKLTVKFFMCSLLNPNSIKEAVKKVTTEMNTNFIDSALLAFPEFEDDEDLCLEVIQPFWEVMEELVEKEILLSIGIADLDKKLLEELCNWATIKPIVNQVNLVSCCVMPEDLKEYAKEHDIQLLTHIDPRDILTSKTLNSIVASCSTEKDGDGWEPEWVLRYSVLIKCRGIIKTKGYVVKAFRDIKKRK